MTRLSNRTILITGAASGLGRRMALLSAERGARPILLDVNRQGLEETNGLLKGAASIHVCDLMDSAEIDRCTKEILDEHGSVDILVNNAGIVRGKSILEMSQKDAEATLQVNTLAPIHLARAFLPAMVKKGDGHVVTVASAGALIGVARLADYSASKFGVFGFHEALRAEIRQNRWPVRSTIVCPYYIDTGMFDGVKTRFSFLLPILKEEKVARRIVRAVEKNRKRLFMPWIVYTVPLLRTLPVSWFDWTAEILGVQSGMRTFTGRQKENEEGNHGNE